MAAKLEYEYIAQTDSQWYREMLRREEEINRFISAKERGRNFYTVTTHDARKFNVHLVYARDFALYLRTFSISDYLPLAKVRAIEKDSQAEKDFKALGTEDARDEYLKSWHGAGAKWKVKLPLGGIP